MQISTKNKNQIHKTKNSRLTCRTKHNRGVRKESKKHSMYKLLPRIYQENTQNIPN